LAAFCTAAAAGRRPDANRRRLSASAAAARVRDRDNIRGDRSKELRAALSARVISSSALTRPWSPLLASTDAIARARCRRKGLQLHPLNELIEALIRIPLRDNSRSTLSHPHDLYL
jgi:hypothetical protein